MELHNFNAVQWRNRNILSVVISFEMRVLEKPLQSPWATRKTKKWVLNQIKPWIKKDEKRLSCFGHITRKQDSLDKTIMLGRVEGRRKRGRSKKRWMDSIKEPTVQAITVYLFNKLGIDCVGHMFFNHEQSRDKHEPLVWPTVKLVVRAPLSGRYPVA